MAKKNAQPMETFFFSKFSNGNLFCHNNFLPEQKNYFSSDQHYCQSLSTKVKCWDIYLGIFTFFTLKLTFPDLFEHQLNLSCDPTSTYPWHVELFCILSRNNFFYYFQHVSESQYFFSNLNSNCSNLLNLRNLQEQVKKAFCYQKLF